MYGDNLGLDGVSILITFCSLGVMGDNLGLDRFSILITVCFPVLLAGVGVYLPIRYRCSKYCVNMIFCKPAVRFTLFTICVVDLFIDLLVETVLQLNTCRMIRLNHVIYLNYAINIHGYRLTTLYLFSLTLKVH